MFGSAARGEDRPDSDLDLLVEMEAGRSLLDHVGLGQDLEDLLQTKVDVLTDASIHPALQARILADSQTPVNDVKDDRPYCCPKFEDGYERP